MRELRNLGATLVIKCKSASLTRGAFACPNKSFYAAAGLAGFVSENLIAAKASLRATLAEAMAAFFAAFASAFAETL
jgi:hypothetical protein